VASQDSRQGETDSPLARPDVYQGGALLEPDYEASTDRRSRRADATLDPLYSPVYSEARLRDPLSEVTRKERRALLVASVLGLVFLKTNVVPTRISALGIEFGRADQATLFSILTLVIGYFLLIFLIYATSDFLAWRLALLASVRNSMVDLQRPKKGTSRLVRDQVRKHQIMFSLAAPVSLLRALVEFLLPVAIGLYTVFGLLSREL
jgi:hypothetical protein